MRVPPPCAVRPNLGQFLFRIPAQRNWTLSRRHASSHPSASEDVPPPSSAPSSPKRRGRPRKPAPSDLFLLRPASSPHSSLATFEAHAAATSLSRTSSVYIGTRYEYLVASSLTRLGFTLSRVGGASDLGIDLVGHWAVPSPAATDIVLRRVLVQCKALAPSPAHVRELEGAVLGAPLGWRGQDTVAFLAARGGATKGVREALQRSRVPMGFLGVESEGRVAQMLWNAAAEEGLAGLGVGTRFDGEGGEEVVLMFEGSRWKRGAR